MPPKSPDLAPTSFQASFLAYTKMLGEVEGDQEVRFPHFVPNFLEAPLVEGEKVWDRAARLLGLGGATRGSASEALDYLKGSRPATEAGKAFRLAKGRALLLGLPIPAGTEERAPAPVPAPAARPANKPASMQLAEAELVLALSLVAKAQAELALLKLK